MTLLYVLIHLALLRAAGPVDPPNPATHQLCSINFARDKGRPAHVDNEAKACLDDVALNLQQQETATLVIVGHAEPESKVNLAVQRAADAKVYLTAEKGIQANRISLRTSEIPGSEADSYLVPSGADFERDVPHTTSVNERTLSFKPLKK
jgi:hypothetical protein